MTILNSGTTKQYSSNWTKAFAAKKSTSGKPAVANKPTVKVSVAQEPAAKKPAAKKLATKKLAVSKKKSAGKKAGKK